MRINVERIKNYLTEHHMTQTDFSARCGMDDVKLIGRVLARGTCRPSTCRVIAQTMEVPMEDLIVQ